jgi:hypothetical protein
MESLRAAALPDDLTVALAKDWLGAESEPFELGLAAVETDRSEAARASFG